VASRGQLVQNQKMFFGKLLSKRSAPVKRNARGKGRTWFKLPFVVSCISPVKNGAETNTAAWDMMFSKEQVWDLRTRVGSWLRIEC